MQRAAFSGARAEHDIPHEVRSVPSRSACAFPGSSCGAVEVAVVDSRAGFLDGERVGSSAHIEMSARFGAELRFDERVHVLEV